MEPEGIVKEDITTVSAADVKRWRKVTGIMRADDLALALKLADAFADMFDGCGGVSPEDAERWPDAEVRLLS